MRRSLAAASLGVTYSGPGSGPSPTRQMIAPRGVRRPESFTWAGPSVAHVSRFRHANRRSTCDARPPLCGPSCSRWVEAEQRYVHLTATELRSQKVSKKFPQRSEKPDFDPLYL